MLAKPTPGVRTVDPAQLGDDSVLYRLRVPLIVRVAGRAALLPCDNQAAPLAAWFARDAVLFCPAAWR